MIRRVCYLLIVITTMMVTGCYQKDITNEGTVYSIQSWVPILTGLGGIIAVVVGIMLLKYQKYMWGIVFAIGGPIATVAIAPMLMMDRVVVSQQGFISTHGFWWSKTIHDIKYAELANVVISVEEKTGRRGRKNYSYYFDCSFKSGGQERVPLGDLMREALKDILQQFMLNKVPVSIPPQLSD